MLDSTNPAARQWFISQLKNVTQLIGINSFKFDAGELTFLPKVYQLYNYSLSPDDCASGYARLAASVSNMIEVRIGVQTQDLPNFVRIGDKDSVWGLNNGLQAMLGSALAISLIGYPFILPDIIG